MIFSGDCVRIPVAESSQVGEVRRWVTRLAADAGFDETRSGKAALVATELANNLVKHAQRTGEFLVQRLRGNGATALELISIDKGPGLANVAQCFADGYSTAGTPGTGLGGIRRASDSFHLHTQPGKGTVFNARIWEGKARVNGQWAAMSVPVHGEEVCGDRWCVAEGDGCATVMIADGLGHGPLAAEAARAAVETFEENPSRKPEEILHSMHAALRATRGAAVAIAAVDSRRGVVHYAGAGNISASIHTGGTSRSLISHNGTVGHEMRKVQEFSYPWESDSTLVMHSDGVTSHWSLDSYAGIKRGEPSLAAAVIYRDFARTRDDATVLVFKGKG